MQLLVSIFIFFYITVKKRKNPYDLLFFSTRNFLTTITREITLHYWPNKDGKKLISGTYWLLKSDILSIYYIDMSRYGEERKKYENFWEYQATNVNFLFWLKTYCFEIIS